jgi:ABC-type nitrate/sulfonate/bicarbonate transport system substrate-binding protein
MKKIALITLVLLAVFSAFGSLSCSPKKESIIVAYSPFESTALFWIAQDQQYFSKNGLELTLRKYDSGAASLSGLLNGEADILVGLTEFPVVRTVFQKGKMAILGNADKGEFIYLIGRTDRGIEKTSDLKGKKVGTAFGTIAQFYLGRFLELNGIKTQDLTLVDLKTPSEWVDAVVNGDVDAVVTAQPYANAARERLGAKGVFWPVQSGQFLHGLVVSTNQWAANHSELVTRFLKSIAQAEEFTFLNPAEAKAIVQKGLDLDAGYMETVWLQNQFTLTLDKSLITAMEDEARWMIENDLTTEQTVPNFNDYIYEDALKAIKPGAVNIIR